MIVADTDVLIDALRGHEPGRRRLEIELGTGRLATTAVTAFELLSGCRTARESERVETLLAALRILALDEAASRSAADVRRGLERVGTPLALADCLVAGTCLAHDAILLTRNRKHFERVPGLVLAGGDRG